MTLATVRKGGEKKKKQSKEESEEAGLAVMQSAPAPAPLRPPRKDEGSTIVSLTQDIVARAKNLHNILKSLVEAKKIDEKHFNLALDEVKLVDRLLLLGPPGVGKSETIFRLSKQRAIDEGRIFVDVRCLMSPGGCPVNLEDIRAALMNVKDEVEKENILRWLKDVKKVDEKGIEFVKSSDKELDGNSELREYAKRKVNIHYEDVVKNPAWFYVYLRVSAPHVFPEDLQYPKPDSGGGGVEFLLPKAFHLFTLPNIKGTLFLDEITNVQRDDQMAMYYTLVLDKELGYAGKLAEGVYVVAAGNPPEWSSIARGLPAALLDRFVVVNVKPPTVEEWIQYMNRMYEGEWNMVLAAFLFAHKDRLLGRPSSEETLTKFPTPRSWTFLALRSDDEIVKYAPGIVGPETASLLYSYLKTPVPSLEELNKNPKKYDELETIEAKYLTILPISLMNPWEAAEKGGNFIAWLAKNHPEHAAVLIMLTYYLTNDAERANEWFDVLEKLAPEEMKNVLVEEEVAKIRSLRKRKEES